MRRHARGSGARPRSRPSPACRCRAARRRARSASSASSASRPLCATRDGRAEHLEQRRRALGGVAVVVDDQDAARRERRESARLRLRRSRVPATSGSRTMNSLPRAGPALRASTRPPCIATRLRTSVRPMPRPPCARRLERSTCVNMSNTESSWSGGDADAVVAHGDDGARRPRVVTVTPMWPPALVYFAALFSRFANTCVEPHRVARQRSSARRARRRSARARRLRAPAGWSRSPTAAPIARSSGSRCTSIDAARDPRHLEQVVHQPDQMIDLALHHVADAQRRRILRCRRLAADASAVSSGASGLRSSWPSVARNSSLR